MDTENTNDFHIANGVFIGAGVVYLIVLVFYIWAIVRIIRRSGYSGWWVLIGLVPILNVIMFFVFAFKKSPTERELEYLRGGAGRAPQRY
ncbi:MULTISPECIES: DUF805 domain-containing protein [unclassified Allobranchiibius]|uniref:DUF805 domain-containing protein n=1 Tax=unclassified Allobranchiibius TaxID=2649857 RepID=UPI001AA1AC99|nr:MULTISPECIES: DUF805 domain-containing protein [unclassified Allobranchiibius]MBO1765898.1 DUF805 domain-containing protein [Allobranchiibius sp. GilTou38]UIJ34877.1 DUF805 domain-containing protein [Allobranchiibius sp. GilTou73]